MRMSVVLAGLLCVCAAGAPASSSQSASLEDSGKSAAAVATMLDRFLRSGKPPLTSYRARRVLEASTRGGRMSASLEAWTVLDPDGTFRFEVIRESGSELIRKRVLLAALTKEQRSRNQKETGQAELTPTNYDFRVDADVGDELVKIHLLPRRKSPMLVNGAVLVTREDGDLLRIEGNLAARPSFWTRRVDIVRSYARIGGVRVPVEMRSRADVLIAGESSFSMLYDYTMINGRPVGSTTGE